jgi:hypothetical protein
MASEVKERSFNADLTMGNGQRLEFVKAELGPIERDKNDFLYASATVSEPLDVYFRCEGDVGYIIVMEKAADGEALSVAKGSSAGSAGSLDDRIKELQQVDPRGSASLGSLGGVAEKYFGVDELGRVFRTSSVEQASYFKIFGRDKVSPAVGSPTEFVYLKSTKSGEFIHVDSLTLGGASESGGTLMKLTVQKRYNSDGSVKTR